MKRKRTNPPARRHTMLAADVVAGAAAGAALGIVAGPPGIAAGAIVGGSIGAFAGVADERDVTRRAARDAVLDEEIGVTSDELGAPNLRHPAAIVGAYSSASAGAASGDRRPAEGPTSTPQDDD